MSLSEAPFIACAAGGTARSVAPRMPDPGYLMLHATTGVAGLRCITPLRYLRHRARDTESHA
jgi:hypothetical protein